MPAAKTYTFGPGSLILGETGTVTELSCQVTSGSVEWDVDSEDDVPLLCGDIEPGDEEFTAALSFNVYQDLGEEDGIVAKSWGAMKGTVQPFEFVPSTAAGMRIVGQVKVRPITVGGDAKTKPRSDVEWPCVGEPILEPITGP